MFVQVHEDEGLWSVVGGTVCAPSKDLWATRSGRVPWVRHDPSAWSTIDDRSGCPHCGGRLRLSALIEASVVARRILTHLARPADVPRSAPGIAPMRGSVGDFNWPGSSGTNWWSDPKEELAVVFMAHSPGAMGVHYRQVINALVEQAIVD